MNEVEFKSWLLQRFGQQKEHDVVADAIARCKRIEKAFGIDLEKVNLETIGYLLTYSKEDERMNRPLPPGLQINGKVYEGVSACKNAIKLYWLFRNGEQSSVDMKTYAF